MGSLQGRGGEGDLAPCLNGLGGHAQGLTQPVARRPPGSRVSGARSTHRPVDQLRLVQNDEVLGMSTLSNPASATSVLELCRAFVRIPSPSGGEGPLAALVAARMAALGLEVQVDRFGTVLGLRRGTRPGPTLLLDAHLDTVPVTD